MTLTSVLKHTALARKNRSLLRSDFLSLAAISFLLIVFYPELFLAQVGSLTGDHLFQHYPWAYLLAESLRHFRLPFWTDLVHCGFPLVAEGQVGAFYPINLILYFLLPFRWAYSYMNCVHFLIAGWGMYFYLRQSKLDPLGAFVASCVYVFGAAYGGAYYNVTSLKTLAWFPWMLFFFERFNEQHGKRDLVLLSLSIAMSLLAGYLQIAVLTVFVFSIYSFVRLFWIKDLDGSDLSQRLKKSIWLILAIGISCVLAFPQLFLTLQLAPLSNRVNLVEDYAYVGSMSPLALSTFVYPSLTSLFRGNNLYLGIGSLFLILCTFFSKPMRQRPLVRTWVVIALIAFLLALGEWSPLYIGAIKLSHFYSFRTPAKFLFFICFAGSILAGCGSLVLRDVLRSHADREIVTRASSSFVCMICFVLFFYFIGYLLVNVEFLRAHLIQLGNWFIAHFIYGRAGHPHTLEVYQEKALGFIAYARQMMDFGRFWNWWIQLVIAATVTITILLTKMKRIRHYWFWGFIVFLFIDLYAISFFDIKRDFYRYNNVGKSLLQEGEIADRLKLEQGEGRVRRFHAFGKPGQVLPLSASFNIPYDLNHTGLYSPFVFARYYETIGLLGGVNDSNAAFTPDASFVLDRFPLLNFIDVSHVVSSYHLVHPQLLFLKKDEINDVYLYRNMGKHSRVHLLTEYKIFEDWNMTKEALMGSHFDPAHVLLLERAEAIKIRKNVNKNETPLEFSIQDEAIKSDSQKWTVKVNRDAFFVVADVVYPGWAARINGEPAPILNAYGLFRAVQLPKADVYEIEFRYTPFLFIHEIIDIFCSIDQ